ncbi:MAG TPA: TetR/AcrR family transcriptional regulator [Pedobacter sp.]
MSKAEQTRLMILQKAFGLIYEKGYQATSIDHIIGTVQVTKGAFFYHFKNKEEMGITLIRELMRTGFREVFTKYLGRSDDPANDIYLMMEYLLLQDPLLDVRFGCPAVNLIEEMAPLNDTFNKELMVNILEWQKQIIAIIEKGKSSGKIRQEVNPENVAYFITSGYAGVRNMGKLFGKNCYIIHLEELKKYLNNLR